MTNSMITAAATFALAAAALTPVHAEPAGAKNIVLVHGGFVDGSGWQGVYSILKKNGYNISIVQNPTTSLADDVAVTKRTIAEQDGPVVLVGHSYGGVVATEAGTDEKVKAVVYIAAFAPDKGESVSSLIANPPAGAADPASGRRLPVPRQSEVRSVLRGRRRCRDRVIHGRLAGSVGRGGTDRRCERTGLEKQAELLPGCSGRPHDPAACAAHDG
jgi:pimeloyl-ACP methyl ester carboxylesterase